MKTRECVVCLDEVRQNLAWDERFIGSYTRAVTLSDGSQRTIKLTLMVNDGDEVVELDDGGQIPYMGLPSTTTNGTLMVRVHELPGMLPAAIPSTRRANNWRFECAEVRGSPPYQARGELHVEPQ